MLPTGIPDVVDELLDDVRDLAEELAQAQAARKTLEDENRGLRDALARGGVRITARHETAGPLPCASSPFTRAKKNARHAGAVKLICAFAAGAWAGLTFCAARLGASRGWARWCAYSVLLAAPHGAKNSSSWLLEGSAPVFANSSARPTFSDHSAVSCR